MRFPKMMALLAITTIVLSCAAQGQASFRSPREQLQQYVTQLQSNPSDDALRTKIIQLALTLDPKPADPPDLLETIGAATYAFKNSQSDTDLQDAANLYAKTTLEAPWRADLYFNEALAFEKAKRLDEAIKAYQFYLLAAPNANDSEAVREKIGALKYQASQQQQQQAQQEEAQRAQQAQAQEEARLNAVVGKWVLPESGLLAGIVLEIARSGDSYTGTLECRGGCSSTLTLQGLRVDGSHVSFTVRYTFRAWQTLECSVDADGSGSRLAGSCTSAGNIDVGYGGFTPGIAEVQLRRQ